MSALDAARWWQLLLKFPQLINHHRGAVARFLLGQALRYIQAFSKALPRPLCIAPERQQVAHGVQVIGLLTRKTRDNPENPEPGKPENPGQYTQIGFLKAGDGVLSVLSRVSPPGEGRPDRVSQQPLGWVLRPAREPKAPLRVDHGLRI